MLSEVSIAQSRALQAAMVRVAEGVHQLLTALAESPVVRGGDSVACGGYMRAVASRFNNYTLLAANDVDGSILCSSAGAVPGSYSNAGRAYHQRAMATGQFVAGDLVTGEVTKRRSLHFALPFQRADGSAGGIVLASVDQAWLSAQLAAAALPPGAQGLILDPAGNLVAAVQDGRPDPGQPGRAAGAGRVPGGDRGGPHRVGQRWRGQRWCGQRWGGARDGARWANADRGRGAGGPGPGGDHGGGGAGPGPGVRGPAGGAGAEPGRAGAGCGAGAVRGAAGGRAVRAGTVAAAGGGGGPGGAGRAGGAGGSGAPDRGDPGRGGGVRPDVYGAGGAGGGAGPGGGGAAGGRGASDADAGGDAGGDPGAGRGGGDHVRESGGRADIGARGRWWGSRYDDAAWHGCGAPGQRGAGVGAGSLGAGRRALGGRGGDGLRAVGDDAGRAPGRAAGGHHAGAGGLGRRRRGKSRGRCWGRWRRWWT